MASMETGKAYLLTVDPSIRACGWAVWTLLHDTHRASPLSSGTIITHRPGRAEAHSSRRDPLGWIDRSDHVTAALQQIARTHRVTQVLIEHPQVFLSAHGQAASNAGSILKLCGFSHNLRATLRSPPLRCVCNFIIVSRWKGTAPKAITQYRIKKRWNLTPTNHNEADALGLGDWYISKILRYQPRQKKSETGVTMRV